MSHHCLEAYIQEINMFSFTRSNKIRKKTQLYNVILSTIEILHFFGRPIKKQVFYRSCINNNNKINSILPKTSD
jgi:hypothetical protein